MLTCPDARGVCSLANAFLSWLSNPKAVDGVCEKTAAWLSSLVLDSPSVTLAGMIGATASVSGRRDGLRANVLASVVLPAGLLGSALGALLGLLDDALRILGM